MALSTRPRDSSDVRNGIPYRRLGRTGEMVSLIGVGGYHLGRQADEEEAIRIVRTAVDNGVNFLDNCWDYNGGASELRMGKALRDGYRDKAFLMTKIDGRNKESAARQIDESLRRLQTDRIDLMQFHDAHDSPLPGELAQHADHRDLDSARGALLDRVPRGAGRDAQRDDPGRA